MPKNPDWDEVFLEWLVSERFDAAEVAERLGVGENQLLRRSIEWERSIRLLHRMFDTSKLKKTNPNESNTNIALLRLIELTTQYVQALIDPDSSQASAENTKSLHIIKRVIERLLEDTHQENEGKGLAELEEEIDGLLAKRSP